MLAIGVLALVLRGWDLDHSFEFGHQVNGAFYGVIAHNYLKFGLRSTALAPVQRGGEQRPEEYFFYLRHPPLVGLLLAGLFWLFGVSHVVARIPFILASLAALFGSAHLARRLAGPRAALWTALIMAVLPAGAFYGSLVDVQGSLIMGFSVLAACAELRYVEQGQKRDLALAWLLGVLAALTDWPGYFLLGLLGVHAFVFGRHRLVTLGAFATGVALFALHLLQTKLATAVGARGTSALSDAGLHHSLYGLIVREGWSGLITFARVSARHIASMLTIPAVLLALLAGALALRRRAAIDVRSGVVLVLLGIALLHILLFPEAATRHDYWFVYLLPPVAIGAALALDAIARGDLALQGTASRATTFLMGALVVAFGLVQSSRLMQRPKPFFQPFGLALNALTRPEDRVLTCEITHAALLFYSDRFLHGKLCDDWFDPHAPGAEGEDPETSVPSNWLPGMTIEKALTALHASRYDWLGERWNRFVVPLEASSYPTHRHAEAVRLLRGWHPSEVHDSAIGPIEVFDLTRRK
jgi:Dolichyl-phosphate-mannose-protein mannosyltransferase